MLTVADLVISYNAGGAHVSFVGGVHTLAGGNVDVQIDIVGVTANLSGFIFA